MAEPKPTRLDSLMLLLVIRVDSSSRPFCAAVDDVRDVERPQGLDRGDDDDHDIDRQHDREDHPEEGLALVRAVDLGRLAEGWIEALQPGQVEDHDVADVAPAGRHEGGPEVEADGSPYQSGGFATPKARRTLSMNPESAEYMNCQMMPMTASDRTTGR